MEPNQQTPTSEALLKATEQMIVETQRILADLKGSRSSLGRSVDAARTRIIEARRAIREAPRTS